MLSSRACLLLGLAATKQYIESLKREFTVDTANSYLPQHINPKTFRPTVRTVSRHEKVVDYYERLSF
jgi:hypothetical protein